MKKIIILVFTLLVSIGFVYAAEENCHELSEDINELNAFVLPKGVPFSKERVNIYTMDDEVVGHIIIDQKIIIDTGCDNITDPTYNVYIKDKETVDDIKSAEKPIDELNAKLKSGDIRIEGETAGKKLKGFFARLGMKIAGWFS